LDDATGLPDIAFSNLCEKIRICLMHYLTIDYVCIEPKPVVKKRKYRPKKHFLTQIIPTFKVFIPINRFFKEAV
jgi:hypothetical protein